MATFVNNFPKKMHLYKSHWVFFCHHGVKIWKKRKRKEKEKKKVWYDATQCKISPKCEKEKEKKGNICYNILKTMPKFENFWPHFDSSFRLIAV